MNAGPARDDPHPAVPRHDAAAASSAPAAAKPVAPDALTGGSAPDWRIWLGLSLTFAWLLLGLTYVDWQFGWSGIKDQPADLLGNFLEGAFAPLAFLWLVIGYFLQQKELAQNTDALRMQFREIQRTADLAEQQSRSIADSERHARQETFLMIAQQVRFQLGAIVGLLYISSQGTGGTGRVDGEQMASLWSELNRGDPEIFSRKMLEVHLAEDDPDERHALFYGTETRARHSNNFIFTFERLLKRSREADTDDGILADTITGSAHGFIYQMALQQRAAALPHLADINLTGRDIRMVEPAPTAPGAPGGPTGAST